MRTTVTIESEIVNKLLRETHAKTKAAAVAIAINDYLRHKKLEQVMGLKGKLGFELTTEDIRHLER